MNGYKNLKLQTDQNILTVSLNRPQTLNAITPELMDDLNALCDALADDTNTRVVIITGAGKGFSSGLDLNVFSEGVSKWSGDDVGVLIRHWQATFSKLEGLPQITIAAINGVCLGAGVELILACDFRVSSSRSTFGLPEIKLGILPDLGGITRLTRLVGPAWAKEVILRGRNISAMEALRIGLVNRVADPGDMPGIARNWAQQFVKLPFKALANAKKLINATYDTQLPQALKAAEYAQLQLLANDEFRAAIAELQGEKLDGAALEAEGQPTS
ncbi:MAG TPA: enoyl-CoA hydratase/isomerase family protein [Anaerolineae bacterium]|nr:enoyl-CoA hydratase/isomerase family protein [Anaerolineae bacterium]